MKKLLLSLTIIVFLLSNCAKNDEDIYFNLRIITFESINSSAGDKLPVEVQRLCMAFEKPSKYLIKGIPVKIDIIRLSDSNFYEKNIFNIANDKNAGNLKYRDYIFKKNFDTAKLGTNLTSDHYLSTNISYILSNYYAGLKESDPVTFLFSDSEIDKPLIYNHYSNIDSLVYAIHRTLFLENKKTINIIISPAGKLVSEIMEGTLFSADNSNSLRFSNNKGNISDSPTPTNTEAKESEIKRKHNIEKSDSAINSASKTKINKGGVIPDKPDKPQSAKPDPPVLRISLKTRTIEWTSLGEGFQYEIIVQNRKGEGENFYFNNILSKNEINIDEFKIKDSRIYNLTLKAKSQDREITKTISFNLIKDGSIIDPRCKSR